MVLNGSSRGGQGDWSKAIRRVWDWVLLFYMYVWKERKERALLPPENKVHGAGLI